jgi:hypothetical protein
MMGIRTARYGLASPPKGKQSASLEVALKMIRKDSYELHRIVKNAQKDGCIQDAIDDTKAKARMIVFLYGRGLLLGNIKEERKKGCKK